VLNCLKLLKLKLKLQLRHPWPLEQPLTPLSCYNFLHQYAICARFYQSQSRNDDNICDLALPLSLSLSLALIFQQLQLHFSLLLLSELLELLSTAASIAAIFLAVIYLSDRFRIFSVRFFRCFCMPHFVSARTFCTVCACFVIPFVYLVHAPCVRRRCNRIGAHFPAPSPTSASTALTCLSVSLVRILYASAALSNFRLLSALHSRSEE
jgi:hypothetical protein